MRSLTFLALVAAAASNPVKQRAVSQDLYDTLFLYQQYAAASYCKANFRAAPGAKLDCYTNNCPDVSAADTAVVMSIPTSPVTDTSGFIATDSTNNLIVVSFRGTESYRNYITDAEVALEPVDLCIGCEGFTGMYTAWDEVSSEVISAVKSAQSANPSFKIVVTGHSLGAGIATVASAEMRRVGLVVDMATYASPRVGNLAWVQTVMNQSPALGYNYRVTHRWDPVPSVPPLASGYAHVSPDYFITTPSGTTPTAADIEVQVGTDNSNPWGPDYEADDEAHDFYFNNVTICYGYKNGDAIPWSLVNKGRQMD